MAGSNQDSASGSASGPGSEHDAAAHRWTARQAVYLWLTGLFVTSLLLANVVGVKLFAFTVPVGPWSIPVEHTAGMLPFPITFLLTDLLNEYYGKKAARRVTYLAFAMALVAFVLVTAARWLPIRVGVPGTATAEAFENIFGAASLMYIASIAAFLVGSLLDIFIFGVFKRLTGGRMVWLRATGSTVISQLFDSLVVTIVFFQVMPLVTGGDRPELGWTLSTALTGYILKGVIAVAMTPLIYAGRAVMARGFGLTPMPPGEHDPI